MKSVCLVHFSDWVTQVTGAYFTSFWWLPPPLNPSFLISCSSSCTSTRWFRCLFVQLIPCISLVILNILLFSAMRRAEQRRRRLTINKTKQVKKKVPRTVRKNTIARYLILPQIYK